MGDPTPATRRLVYERDQHQCVASWLPGPCWGGLTLGHIIGRGMGGGDQYDTPRWLVTQCLGHNTAIEQRANVALQATRLGMKVDRIATALIPERPRVTYPDGIEYYLNDDGTRERVPSDPWE